MLDTNSNSEVISGGKPTTSDNRFNELLDLFYGNWIWRAVHGLANHPKFNSSPTWISETLNISIEEAVDAFEGLEDLGLLIRDSSNGIKANIPNFIVPKSKTERTYLLQKHKLISQQILSRSTPQNTEGSLTLFVNVKREELYAALDAAFNTLNALGTNQDNLELYALTLTCSNLAPNLTQDRK